MPAGIRATVEFDSPSVCPVASVAHSTDSVVDSVSTSVVSTPGEVSVSEFVLEADDPPDASALEPPKL